jgi:hypothetical protein
MKILKTQNGSRVYLECEWRTMYYSHIDLPSWKAILNNDPIIVEPNMNISAYYVNTFCKYKNYKCQVVEIRDNMVVINPSIELQRNLNDYAQHGYDPLFEVKEDDLDDIWEERTPIEGFKFNVESISYIKKKEIS